MRDRNVIHTDEQGRPFPRPVAPAPEADIETWLEFFRELYAYNDAITDRCNRAFDQEFRRALRR